MNEIIKGKRNYIIALAILFVLVSLSETTYSLFLQSNTTDEFNYNTGLLDLTFTEDEQITLENVFPTNDSEAIKSKPYHLIIKNTGTIAYLFDLKMVGNNNENSIDKRYIKFKVNNNLPNTLSYTNDIIASNLIIFPGEEMTFDINVWLDINTPNNELGKTFNAKVVTSGSSIYKTIDSSGANHPKLNSDMLPVYYDESETTWKIADNTNLLENYTWYNYDESIWANSVTIKNSSKKIYDITRNNDLNITDITYNNGNAVIDDKYLDLNLTNYSYNNISNILRVKFNDLTQDKIYLIAKGNMSYYYDNNNKTFTFKVGNSVVNSTSINLENNKWYILGYTYDKNTINFYLDGKKISTQNISGSINNSSSFKVGTNPELNEVSKLTIGDILIYNRILSNTEISNNYQTSIKVVTDGLVAGYDEFVPMTLREYYLTKSMGFTIKEEDILSSYVWIPRYKYRLWNVMGESNTDSYDAYNKGIDIVFENNNTSSGTIYCENNHCFSDKNKMVPVTKDDNGKYYTHPAFTNTNGELTGLWVSKYEISKENDNITSKKENNILIGDYLSTYYKAIKNISNENNYHIIKNTEWGSIVYLTHSKYGLCPNGSCKQISSSTVTVSGSDALDSTTANIYGVFDMAGGASEYTMSNISNDNNLNLSNSYFDSTPIGTDDYDLYQNDTFILGDATKEFSNNTTTYNWYTRTGIFSYSTSNDIKDNNLTTRIVTK